MTTDFAKKRRLRDDVLAQHGLAPPKYSATIAPMRLASHTLKRGEDERQRVRDPKPQQMLISLAGRNA